MSVTFWALFGEVERDYFHVPEKGFEILTGASVIIFGAFNIAAVLVALNMLIAILNESYTRISVSRNQTLCKEFADTVQKCCIWCRKTQTEFAPMDRT